MKITLHNNSIIIRATDRFTMHNCRTEYADDLAVDVKAAEFLRALDAGGIRTLVSHERVTGDTGLLDVRLVSVDGVPGNSDPRQLAIEGWRGTTDDVATYAHGLVLITDVRRLARGYGYRVSFKRVADDS